MTSFIKTAEDTPAALIISIRRLKNDVLLLHLSTYSCTQKVNSDGSILVEEPLSKAGDKIILKALMNITLGVAACSVSESKCNSGKCFPLFKN